MALDELGLAEEPAIEVFEQLGYTHVPGPELADERESLGDVVLRERLREHVHAFNPEVPRSACNEAIKDLLSVHSPDLLRDNRRVHEMLTNGIHVEYEQDGEERGRFVHAIDFDNPGNNDWLVSTQFSVKLGDGPRRRPDMVVFCNGLPIAVLEFKDPTNPSATLENAYEQVCTRYRKDIPDLFRYNELIGLMDLTSAKLGCLDAGWEWFRPWRYVEEEGDEPEEYSEQETLLRGAFEPERLLDLIEGFVVYSDSDGSLTKLLAGYHQFYGVREAVESTGNALGSELGRAGVFWHTQGSGKSLSMVFYVRKIRRESQFENPTFVVVTDRNELDEQLHDTFVDAGFSVDWADSIDDLRGLLDREAGGIVFTTVQKFQTVGEETDFPTVNEREDVIVIADEAHRSQTQELGYNLRVALPNAAYLGFTATPIHEGDRATKDTFGSYVSQYTIDRAEADGATVPIYYESRFAKLELNREEIADRVREVMDSADEDLESELTEKWTTLRTVIEHSEKRLQRIADDIVSHFNDRGIEGKGMVVAISRKAAVEYKNRIEANPDAPEVAVVISDPEEYIDDPVPEERLKRRYKDPDDPLELVVVCDKWTTGFDCPPMHTMYIDRPMKNHNLLQTIGRVNRVYNDKPGGLIVDYIGIAEDLKRALDKYTSDIHETAMTDLETAIELLHRKHERVASFLSGVEYENWRDLEKLELSRLYQRAQSEVIATEEKEQEFMDTVAELERVYGLVMPHQAAQEIRSDLLFFKGVRNGLKDTSPKNGTTGSYESALKEVIQEGVSADDIVTVTGFDKWSSEKPILNDEFLADVEQVEETRLQVRLLEKLLRSEIETRKERNLTKYESFEKELEETLEEYNKQFLTTDEVISQLKRYAAELQQTDSRMDELGLSEEELAFYDAVSENTTVEISDEDLIDIATELRDLLRKEAKLDWTNRNQMRAQVKMQMKSVLRKKGLTHSQYEPLISPVMQQAEALYSDAGA
ncbi:type I restriction endonuclease subunit R [Halolamina rubra]|uniref:type I restriction endonuclease subunit R n=1 Tax=Halolamina rubra TaxID=1380430 RepID=UPI000679B088|nr:type I restriction endonuclease subunit R [Halolamina rubra]